MDPADLCLTITRAIHLAALLSAFGILAFWNLVAPPVLQTAGPAQRASIESAFLRLLHASLALSLATAVIWLATQAAVMAEPDTVGDAEAAIWPVLTDTHFGHILGLRFLLILGALLTVGNGSQGWRLKLGAILAGLGLILHAWATHAAAAQGMDRPILLATESLHLAAAGAWLGSLAPLFIVVGRLPASQGAMAARRFSPLGMLCAAALTATALIQSGFLIGGLTGLIDRDYGLVALVKLAILAVLLSLAAMNRFRHLPAMSSSESADARRRLRRNIGLETAAGLAAVLAAAFLSSLPPARHSQSASRMSLPMLAEIGQSSQFEYGTSASAPS